MRIIYLALLLFLLIMGSGIYTEITLEKQSKLLKTELDELQKSILEENEQQREEHLANIGKQWTKARKLWVLLIDHHELEDFELSLARAKSFLLKNNIPSVLAEIATMKQLAVQIHEKQQLTLENVF